MTTNDHNLLTHPAVILLNDLIRRESVTPNDAGCQEILAARLAAMGFQCEWMPFGEVTNLFTPSGYKRRLVKTFIQDALVGLRGQDA